MCTSTHWPIGWRDYLITSLDVVFLFPAFFFCCHIGVSRFVCANFPQSFSLSLHLSLSLRLFFAPPPSYRVLSGLVLFSCKGGRYPRAEEVRHGLGQPPTAHQCPHLPQNAVQGRERQVLHGSGGYGERLVRGGAAKKQPKKVYTEMYMFHPLQAVAKYCITPKQAQESQNLHSSC